MPSMDPNVVELEKELGRVEPAGEEAAEKGTSRWADPKFRRGVAGVAAVLALVTVVLLRPLPQPRLHGRRAGGRAHRAHRLQDLRDGRRRRD